jgi:type IV secretion/conjugal transfer VirB4 family ATPase
MLLFREHPPRSLRLPDFLPWYGLIGPRPGLILQKAEALQKTYSYRGPDMASSGIDELIHLSSRLNSIFMRGDGDWSFFVEAQRFQAPPCPSSRWPNATTWIVDHERRQNLLSEKLQLESSYYLTFVWQLPADIHKRFVRLFYEESAENVERADTMRDIEFFLRTTEELADILAGVCPEVVELDDTETLTYLHSTISTNRHPVLPPYGGTCLDALLPDMAFTPGDCPMLGEHYIPTAVVTQFPPSTAPGLLDALNRLGIEYRWVTRWNRLTKEQASRELGSYRRKHLSKRKTVWKMFGEHVTKEESSLVDNAAVNRSADADAALQVLGADLASFGRLTVTVTVWDRHYQLAREKIRTVKQVIQSHGLVVRDETLNSQEAWLGSLPGKTNANVRQYLTSSINLAHLMPASAVWSGHEENSHLADLTGQTVSHVYCSTSGTTPFRLNLAVGDVGHTLVIGPTGAGKSTLLILLALQWLRYRGARLIIFDKDRSSRAATMAVGGRYYEPGRDEAAVAFQPLRQINDKAERIWAAQFIVSLFLAQGHKESPGLKENIDHALDVLADKDPEQRTLSAFADQLGDPDLAQVLRPYTVGGNYGQIFDSDHDDVRASDWLMFEMGPLMQLGPEVIGPALAYLFHRVEATFDGRPTLLILDEAWRFLQLEIFARQLQAWLKTLRKKNVYVVFATQEVADAVDSPILSTILSACHTRILLPDQEATSPVMQQAYKLLGLSDTEIRILAQAEPKRDYYYTSPLGRRLFSLDFGPTALAFAGFSSEQDQQALDRIVAGVSPERYAELILRHRRLDWAADLVAQAGATRAPFFVS